MIADRGISNSLHKNYCEIPVGELAKIVRMGLYETVSFNLKHFFKIIHDEKKSFFAYLISFLLLLN
jgi:hypothetical protein